MTQRHWFSLALRVLGVMQIIDALTLLAQAYDIQLQVFKPQVATVTASLHYSLVHAIIGLVLLLGAPFLSAMLVERDPPKS